jgi:hypothetical protein
LQANGILGTFVAFGLRVRILRYIPHKVPGWAVASSCRIFPGNAFGGSNGLARRFRITSGTALGVAFFQQSRDGLKIRGEGNRVRGFDFDFAMVKH